MARLKEQYREKVIPALMKEFSYNNIMEVPRLEKIVINMGLGEAIQNAKILDSGQSELAAISGQIGCKVTMRRDRMYEFFDRLVNVALPRIRDFRGVSGKSFDGRGNYALGIREQIIFPEIDYDKIDKIKGMNIVITTTAKTDEEGKALLKMMGMPFRD